MLPISLPSAYPPPQASVTVSSSSSTSPSAPSSTSSAQPAPATRPKSRRHVQAAHARRRLAPQRCPHCAQALDLPAVLAQNVQTASIVVRLVLEQRTGVTSAIYANVVGVTPTQARHALNSAAREKLVVRRREQGRDGRYHYRYDPTRTALAYLVSSSLARSLQRWLTDSDALA